MHFKVDPIIRRTVSYFSLIKAITTTTSNIIIVVLTIAIAIIIILFCTNVKASLCEGRTCHLSLGPEVYTHTHTDTQTMCNACNSYLYLKLFVYLSASLSLFLLSARIKVRFFIAQTTRYFGFSHRPSHP